MKPYLCLLLIAMTTPSFAGVVIVDEDRTPANTPTIRPTFMSTTDKTEQTEAGSQEPIIWEINPEKTKTYKEALTRWATTANWELIWNLPKPYQVANRAQFSGSFIDVFSSATEALGRAIGPIDVHIYKGSRVITIEPLTMPKPLPVTQGKR